MAKSLNNLTDFTAGEISPRMDARVDSPTYRKALRQCLNMMVFKQGPITRRPGTLMMAPTKLAGAGYCARGMPFVFSPNVSFYLEWGNQYVRFYVGGPNGTPVLLDRAPTWVTATDYPAGSFVQSPDNAFIYYTVAGINGGTTDPSLDHTHWVEQDIYEVPTPYSAVVAPLWVVGTTYPPNSYVTDVVNGLIYYTASGVVDSDSTPSIYIGATPWSLSNYSAAVAGTDVFQIVPCQINDVVYLVHAQGAYPVYSLTRYGNTDWVMKEVDFLTPALLDQNTTNTTIAASATTGSGVTLTATAPAWSTGLYYEIANSVVEGGNIYDCLVAHVAGTFATDLAAGYWQEVSIFNALHIGSTWQLGYLEDASYLELDGTASGGFSTGTDSEGGSWSSLPYTSNTIQCLGAWEVHTYGVWTSDVAIEQSSDGGNTWAAVSTTSGRSDRNVDITGTASQLSLFRIVLSVPSGVSPTPVNPGATNPRVVFECVDAFLYGLVEITAVASSYSATATVVTQLSSTDTTPYWSEAAWSEYRGYPQAVCQFQQRLVYGGSGFEPQRIWGTVTNDIENFNLGDQTLATDAFVFDINAPARGPIQWLLAQLDLFVGFAGAEWIVNSGATTATGAGTGSAITPSNISATEQSSFGSTPGVQPQVVGDALLFCQRQATTIRQMIFSIQTAKYMSDDLTSESEHLFNSGIVQLAYQQRWRGQGLVWVVTQQGELCAMSYEQNRQVSGWHRHATGVSQPLNGNTITDNGFESVVTLPGNGTADDEVWVIVSRQMNGGVQRFVERLNPVNWEIAFTGAPNPPAPDLTQAYYMDCGMTITHLPYLPIVNGLSYFNGRSVIALADGVSLGPVVVSGGQVTLSCPSTVSKVQIGLPIAYAGQPMRSDSDPRAGSTQGLVKAISDLYLRVFNSNGGQVWNGSANSVPKPIPYTLTANLGGGPALVTTPTDIRITPLVSPAPILSQGVTDPIIIVQGSDALPLTVLALVEKYDVEGMP
jgi:hypothetical protein